MKCVYFSEAWQRGKGLGQSRLGILLSILVSVNSQNLMSYYPLVSVNSHSVIRTVLGLRRVGAGMVGWMVLWDISKYSNKI